MIRATLASGHQRPASPVYSVAFSAFSAFSALTLFSVPVPAGSSLVQVYTTGGGTGVDLYLMRPNGTQACRSRNGNGGESCAVSNPVSGNWEVRVYRDSGANFSNVHVHALTASESAATPTGRGQAEELLNIATWYSYHRTRMKAAKAGASKAFGEIGSTVRVGFRTIWGRNGNQDNSNWPTQDDPIPVNYNDGLFDDIVSGVIACVQSPPRDDGREKPGGSLALEVLLAAVGAVVRRLLLPRNHDQPAFVAVLDTTGRVTAVTSWDARSRCTMQPALAPRNRVSRARCSTISRQREASSSCPIRSG